jgi:hypothetical protein
MENITEKVIQITSLLDELYIDLLELYDEDPTFEDLTIKTSETDEYVIGIDHSNKTVFIKGKDI